MAFALHSLAAWGGSPTTWSFASLVRGSQGCFRGEQAHFSLHRVPLLPEIKNYSEAIMLKNKIIQSAFILAFVLPYRGAWAQSGPVSGLYEITSGRYSECCGIAGNDFGYDLPDKRQRFARFTFESKSPTASLTFLGEDARTVFSTVPCPPSGALQFSFEYGLVFPDRVIFHVDPGPPPYAISWNYTVSN